MEPTYELGVPLAEVLFCPGCGRELDSWLVDPEHPRCYTCDADLLCQEIL